MSPIELSKVQKSKLLDMCNKLFPKEKINFIDKDGNLCEETIYDRSWFYLNKIHWFEFCVTKLFKKLNLSSYSHLMNSKQHPIDYLYEQFKQLKQTK